MSDQNISELYKAVCAKYAMETNPEIYRVLQECAGAETFTIKLTGSSRLQQGADVIALAECLKHSKQVTGLDVSYSSLGDEGVRFLADLLQGAESSLRSLDLTFNNITGDGAKLLASSLQVNTSLLSLNLSCNHIKRGAVQLAAALQLNNTLQELQLAECHLETQGLISLAIMLKSNTSLRSVDLSRSLLFTHEEEWAQHFSEMLVVNSGLVELHLAKMTLSDGSVEMLCAGLKVNCHLRHLDLRCNNVTRDGAHHLAAVLKQNPTLEVLDLSANRIEDEGAGYLSDVIAWSGCSLRELSVCRNNIHTNGLLSLCESLKTNATLTHIYVWGNRLDEPVCLAISSLLSSGRLQPEHVDVRPYQVDDHMFLAEVSHTLRSHTHNTQ